MKQSNGYSFEYANLCENILRDYKNLSYNRANRIFYHPHPGPPGSMPGPGPGPEGPPGGGPMGTLPPIVPPNIGPSGPELKSVPNHRLSSPMHDDSADAPARMAMAIAAFLNNLLLVVIGRVFLFSIYNNSASFFVRKIGNGRLKSGVLARFLYLCMINMH